MNPQFQSRRSRLLAALALVACLKVALLFAPPLADEAYYWMWGQFLDWSYHDHPPLNALLLRLSNELFGWNLFALRAPALLTYAVSFTVIAWWGARLSREPAGDGRLTAVAAIAVSPLFFVYQSLVVPDHVLIACLLVSVHFFVLFVESTERARPTWLYLYAAAIAVGLAALAKYSAVFVGLGYVGWFLFTPVGRSLLASPHIWIAGLLAAAMQAPVIWWNYQHDLTSFRFHLTERFFGGQNILAIAWRFLGFAGVAALLFSPFLVTGLVRFLARRSDGDIGRFRAIGVPAIIASIAVFAALTIGLQAHFYWLIAPLAVYLPVAAAVATSREIAWHLGFGIIVSTLLTVHLSIIPISSLAGIRGVEDASFGMADVASRAQAEVEGREADLLLGSHYMLAALLGFELGRANVHSISQRAEQYDIWFDFAEHAGESAIIVADMHRPLYSFERERFTTLEEIGRITTTRFGIPVNEFIFYHGTGLHP